MNACMWAWNEIDVLFTTQSYGKLFPHTHHVFVYHSNVYTCLMHSPFTGVQNEVQSTGTGSSCIYVTPEWNVNLLYAYSVSSKSHHSDTLPPSKCQSIFQTTHLNKIPPLKGQLQYNYVHTHAFIKYTCGQQCWLLKLRASKSLQTPPLNCHPIEQGLEIKSYHTKISKNSIVYSIVKYTYSPSPLLENLWH